MESLKLYPVAGTGVDWLRLRSAFLKGAGIATAAGLVASSNSSWTLASICGATVALWLVGFLYCSKAAR